MKMHSPKAIHYHKQTRELELSYNGGQSYRLAAEYLRVHSPSAEVKGHGEGDETLQVGKINVALKGIEPVGNYALKLTFDDGHDSGIYTWGYLRELCDNQEGWWQAYLDKLNAAGESRDPNQSIVRFME